MDTAIAMKLGGKVIQANECGYYSYIELGLLCPYCREPVLLKQGDQRQPHFAHFPDIASRKLEECNLRQSNSGYFHSSTEGDDGKGQRLKSFQDHFLQLIVCSVNNIPSQNYLRVLIERITQVESKFSPGNLQEIITKTIQFIKYDNATNLRLLDSIYTDLRRLGYVENNDYFNLAIAKEAFSYLQTASSEKILKKLAPYFLGEVEDDDRYRKYVLEEGRIPYVFSLGSSFHLHDIARTIRYYLLYRLIVTRWELALTGISYDVPTNDDIEDEDPPEPPVTPSNTSSPTITKKSKKARRKTKSKPPVVPSNTSSSPIENEDRNSKEKPRSKVEQAIIGAVRGVATVGIIAGVALGALFTLGKRK